MYAVCVFCDRIDYSKPALLVSLLRMPNILVSSNSHLYFSYHIIDSICMISLFQESYEGFQDMKMKFQKVNLELMKRSWIAWTSIFQVNIARILSTSLYIEFYWSIPTYFVHTNITFDLFSITYIVSSNNYISIFIV